MKFYQYLIEKKLMSEFTFGYELECIAYYDDLRKLVKKFMGSEIGRFENDSSIGEYGDKSGLEWTSPVFNFSPKNINNTINMLSNMKSYDIHTNKTCGFHVHVAFPGINEKDMIWIVSHLSLDENMIRMITNFKKYEFFNDEYADKDYLKEIKNSIKNRTFDFDFNDEKYNLIRLHPQGTLEWRGPRDFLNNINLREIKDFFKLLYKFISWMNEVMDRKTIDGMSKEEYFSNIVIDEFLENKKNDSRFLKEQDKKTIEKIFKKFPWINKLKFKHANITIKNNKLVFRGGVFGGTWRDGIWQNGTWQDGIWQNGTWRDGIWQGGNWKNGYWYDGIWYDGTWENGTWENGYWKDGTWENGTWKDGTWENGTWKDGTWEKGTWDYGIWKHGTWKDGNWKDGTWKDGTWKDGYWEDGYWEDGTWKYGYWEYGIWENGTWDYGIWKHGTWKDGNWKDGNWKDGYWEGGYWEGGYWEGGYWRNGEILSKKFKEYVISRVNPKEFYKLEQESKSLEELKTNVS